MEHLLRNNADPGVRDKQGYSAVHYASAYGCTLCLELVSTAAALSKKLKNQPNEMNLLHMTNG